MAFPGLDVAVESNLPTSLAADSPTALFVFGHCYHERARVTGLELLVDGVRHRPRATGMPRDDLHRWRTAQGRDPSGHSRRSGFWALLPVVPRTPGPVRLEAAVGVDGRAEEIVGLAEIPVAARARAAVGRGHPSPARLAICMATYEPDPDLFAVQVESLRAQTVQDWRCIVSDGGSSAGSLSMIEATFGDDPRFDLHPAGERLGPYENFERALELVEPGTELVALADQDDRWHPDKLAALQVAIDGAVLAYGDARLVAADGRVLGQSLWTGRRRDSDNLASLLVANSIPGATMLMRSELLETALPFPALPGFHYHDHWLALAAVATGEVHYVDRALQDYIQHGAAVMGDAARARRPVDGSRGLRDAYFGGVVPREIQAATLLLRAGPTLDPRRRRALAWFLGASRAPLAFGWLALRPLRELAGRGETLGGEAALARGIAWRHLVGWAARSPLGSHRAADARFPDPPHFEQPRLRRWRGGA